MDISKICSDFVNMCVIEFKKDDNMEKVNEILQSYFIRHLPVTENGEGKILLGLITNLDVLQFSYSKLLPIEEKSQVNRFKRLKASEVMSTGVPVVEDPDIPIEEAAKILLEKKSGCLPILKDGALVGIITEADFCFLVANLISRRKTKQK